MLRPSAIGILPVMLLASIAAAGCGGGADREPGAVAEDQSSRSWRVRGVFLRSSFEGQAMRVDHEEIPGFMGAMAMDLRLADPTLVNGLVRGDKIRFDLHDRDGMLVVTAIEKLPADTRLETGSTEE